MFNSCSILEEKSHIYTHIYIILSISLIRIGGCNRLVQLWDFYTALITIAKLQVVIVTMKQRLRLKKKKKQMKNKLPLKEKKS